MKAIYFLILIFISTSLMSPSLLAQSDYNLSWYTDSEGLPQNSVLSIFKDKYGFIWVSTSNGLARYNGTNFKIFDSETISKTTSNRMCSFFGSVIKDSVYTINGDGNLILINRRTAKRAPDAVAGNLDLNEVERPCFLSRFISRQSENNVKIRYTSPNPIQRYNSRQKGIFLTNNRIFKNTQRDLSVKEDSLKRHLKGQYFTKDSTLYCLTDKGNLYRFKNGLQDQLTIQKKLLKDALIIENKTARQLFMFKNHALWLIGRIGKNTLERKKITSNLGVYPQNITCLYFDRESESIFIGSINKGLGIAKKKFFRSISNPSNSRENVVYSLQKINDSTIVTGTGTVIQNDQIIEENDFSQFSDNYFLAYLHNSLWTTKNNQLYRLKKTDNYRFQIENSYSIKKDLRFSLLLPRGKDSLWLATTGSSENRGTLYSTAVNKKSSRFHKIIETDFNITSLVEINRDSLYLGSDHGGLYLLKNYRHNPTLESIATTLKVRSFHTDGTRFWVTSYNKGFAFLNQKKLTYFPVDKNNYLRIVHCIVDDGEGFFWLTTNRGLFKVSKANLNAFIRDQANHVYYTYFDKSSGFLTNEFNGGGHPCGIKLTNHRIYFPSLDGVVSFYPDDLQRTPQEKDIYIEEVAVDGQKKMVTDSVTLKRGFNRLTFSVTSPFYRPLNNVQVEAMLDNGQSQKKWSPIGPDRQISYTNLSAGDYTFKVRKRSSFSENFQTDQIHIYIPPSFWQKLWFKLIVILLNVLVVIGIISLWIKNLKEKKKILENRVKQRTATLKQTIQQLKETEQERTKELSFQKSIMSSISHDLVTPTKYLTLFSKKIYDNPDNYRPYNNGEMALIHQTSRQINNFIENLLIYTKANIRELDQTKENISIRDFIDDCQEFHKIPLTQRNIKFENRIDPQATVRTNMNILKIIIQNILDNAIKHTSDGRITASSIRHNGSISIILEDDGIGIEKNKLRLYRNFFVRQDLRKKDLDAVGLGFKITKQLLPYIDGKIAIDSFEQTGTTFKITCLASVQKDLNNSD